MSRQCSSLLVCCCFAVIVGIDDSEDTQCFNETRDGKDNDGDGLIDEEVCVTYVTMDAKYYFPDGFIPDFDLDNKTNEDCGVNITFKQGCECPCYIIRPKPPPNMTVEEKQVLIYEKIKKIQKDLQLNIANLTSVIAKKISAKDERTSSIGMGILAITMLVLTFGGIFLLDIGALKNDYNILISNIKR